MANIKFGTDGWRGILGKEFNEENFTLAVNAVGKYLFDHGKKEVLIGYDPRRAGDYYAGLAAGLLSNQGIDVKLSSKVVPTPVLAYYAGLTSTPAIMLTASHNPPEYLGLKFIPEYAGPATDDITSEIMANIGKKLVSFEIGEIQPFDFFDEYEKHLYTLIDFDRIKRANIPFIFDGLYSSTIGYFDKILDNAGIGYKSIRIEHDPDFGGGMPDPKPKYLTSLVEEVKKQGCVGLANDGDGDRFGVIDEDGEYVSPNEIISILAGHLIKNKGAHGVMIKTVGSSILIEKAAEKLGVPVVETAVGFKHVGNAMRKNKTIIGGEESGGLSIGGHIPEKDGILANLLVLEAMVYSGKQLRELRKDLYDFVGAKYYTDRIDLGFNNREEINCIIDRYKKVERIGEFSVTRKNLIDGVKLYLGEDTTILIRPSGTEPLLRIYFESSGREMLESLKKIDYTCA